MATVYKRKNTEQDTASVTPSPDLTQHAAISTKRAPKWAWWVTGFICILVFTSFLPESKGGDKDFDAWYFATEFVKDSLKAPSTSKFSPYRESVSVNMGNSHYQVIGWVDAENSFGAMLRKGWIVKLRHDDKSWYCENIEMD